MLFVTSFLKICRFIGTLPKAAFAKACARKYKDPAIYGNSENSLKVSEVILMPPETCCAARTYLTVM
jgi:hypothetical protein